MKKTIAILLFILVLGSVFATDNYIKCSQLIDKKLKAQTVSLIQQYSKDLTDTEKYTLYKTNETNGLVPFTLNLLLGCGIGSFVQGDTTGGILTLAVELVDFIGYFSAYGRALNATTQVEYDSAVSSMTIWAVSLIVARVCECIEPFIYSNQYNKRLSNAIYGSPSFVANPQINKDGTVGLKFSAKLSY